MSNFDAPPPPPPYGGQPSAANGGESDKEFIVAVILSWLLGTLGVDRFYMGYTGIGVAKLLTAGGCGVWALIDAIMITMGKVPDAQGRPLKR
ncbi:MAG: hypothetical protein RL745_48 [Actinomycetota bacterium]